MQGWTVDQMSGWVELVQTNCLEEGWVWLVWETSSDNK